MSLRVSVAGLVALCMVAVGLVVATPAQAYVDGPPCSAASCVGRDPGRTVDRAGVSCRADAYQVKDPNGLQGYAMASPDRSLYNAVFLMYSPRCNANWVEAASSSSWCAQNGGWRVESVVNSPQGPVGTGDLWSKMVNGAYAARAAIYGDCLSSSSWYYSNWR
ncbi:hypothetical protein [Dactylosporangium sp. NPDC048998]|uniref:hypothetical protein n=1 Tax=Dactylosporangium sp. NPDC048998 TaxID=3363976 RepID=UPI00371A2845